MKKESRESLATLIFLKLSNLNILERSSFTKSVNFDYLSAKRDLNVTGFEPAIFCSVGRRVIRCATRPMLLIYQFLLNLNLNFTRYVYLYVHKLFPQV